jgi:hypothetical protein
VLFRVETYIIQSPDGGDDADADDAMYMRSFLLYRQKCKVLRFCGLAAQR